MNIETAGIALRVLIYCGVFAYFILMPLRSRCRFNGLKTGLLVVLMIAITILITILFLTPDIYFYQYSSWGILIWLVCGAVIYCTVIRRSYFEVLFIFLVVLNLYVNMFAIVKTIASTLELTSPAVRFAVSIGVLAAHIPLFWVLMMKLYKRVVEFNINFSFWKYIWMIPALTYLIFYVKIINDYWKNLDQAGTGDIVFSILWSFTTYVFFLVTLQMLIQAYDGVTAREQAKLTAAQLQMQQGQYKKLLEQIEDSARLRHDLRHHLLSINSFAENNNLQGLKAYLESLTPEYLVDEELSVCENHLVDVILRHYTAVAKTDGVSVQIRAGIPQKTCVADMDLCVIFGNLMENAIEACRSQKSGPGSIGIRAAMNDDQLVIIIQNTFENEVTLHNGTYESTKRRGTGIGLSSVKRVVEKYGGIMKVDHSDSLFRVSIYLNTPGESDNG